MFFTIRFLYYLETFKLQIRTQNTSSHRQRSHLFMQVAVKLIMIRKCLHEMFMTDPVHASVGRRNDPLRSLRGQNILHEPKPNVDDSKSGFGIQKT